MMHSARVSALVVAFIVGSVAMAHAECAWVLWKEAMMTGGNIVPPIVNFTTLGGYKDREECVTVARTNAESARASVIPGIKTEHVGVDNDGAWTVIQTVGVPPKTALYTGTYRCLPDTIDPREPKAT